ncbi:MerR family transcriptional regulator [Lacticaseibacillus sp. GG6-2]
MENEFTIGQMAALNATTVKTLRYYDQIGLLKPARVDAASGYRYYTVAQFERLNTIQYLSRLGLSLATIQAHLAQPHTDSFLAMLATQRQQIHHQIATLHRIDAQLEARIADIQTAAQAPVAQPFTQLLPQRNIVRLDTPIHHNDELELALRRMQSNAAIYIGGVGLLLDQAALLDGRFADYSGLFVLVETNDTTTATLPAGEYACIRFNGDHTQAGDYYRRLLNQIAELNATVSGFACERTIIDQDISSDPAAYRTEIQIPIQR